MHTTDQILRVQKANLRRSLWKKGTVEIAKALWSKYTDVRGKAQSVGGDMTKVCYVPGLSTAAQI